MALDFMKAVFGGSEQTSQSTSTPVDMTPPEYAGLRPVGAGAVTGQVGQGTQTGYGGPLNAQITTPEQSTLNLFPGLVGPGSASGDYLRNTMAGQFLPGGAQQNPFYSALLQANSRPILEGLTDVLERTLPGRFTRAGQFTQPGGSSAFDMAAARASSGAANALSDMAARTGAAAWMGERQNQQQAAQLQQQEVQGLVSTLQAQGLPRMIEEMGIERGLALFQERTKQLLQYIQMALAAGQPVVANQQTSVGTGESTTGIVPALGSIGFKPKFPT